MTIINNIHIDDNISISSYIQFLEKIDLDENHLKSIFDKSLHIYFIESIKRLDFDMFIKLLLFSLSTSRMKTNFIKIDYILFLIDGLFLETKYKLELEIRRNTEKTIKLRDVKMKLLMEIYKSKYFTLSSYIF